MTRVRPTISVITPSLNSGRTIERAIESVLVQDYEGVQHIVCDGGSSDQTRDILSQYPHLSVYCGPDQSSHHAANAGLTRATGEWIGFICADDWYEPGAFDVVADILHANPMVDMLCGVAAFHGGGSPSFHRQHRRGAFLVEELTLGVPAFNSYFFRRNLLLRLGGFRTQFNYAADRDLLLRGIQKATCHVSDRHIYNYLRHPGSRTMNGNMETKRKVRVEHLAIAADLSRDRAAPLILRRGLARWLAFETGQLAQIELRQGRVLATLRHLIANIAHLRLLVPAIAIKLRMQAEDRRRYVTVIENSFDRCESI